MRYFWVNLVGALVFAAAVSSVLTGCCTLFCNSGNSDSSEAEFLSMGRWQVGEVGPGGVKWYRFRVGKPGEVAAQLILNGDYCTHIYIYDTDQTTEVAWDFTCRRGEAYLAEAKYDLGTGEYYLKVEGRPGTGYRLRVKNRQVRWRADAEPNDIDGEARRVFPGMWVSGAVGFYSGGHRDVQDWYSLKVDFPARLTALLNVDRDRCAYLYLYGGDGVDALARGWTCSESHSAKLDYHGVRPGRYYLVVQAPFGTGYRFLYKLLRREGER